MSWSACRFRRTQGSDYHAGMGSGSRRAGAITTRRGADVFDIKWIRDNAEAFDAGLKKRGLRAAGG